MPRAKKPKKPTRAELERDLGSVLDGMRYQLADAMRELNACLVRSPEPFEAILALRGRVGAIEIMLAQAHATERARELGRLAVEVYRWADVATKAAIGLHRFAGGGEAERAAAWREFEAWRVRVREAQRERFRARIAAANSGISPPA